MIFGRRNFLFGAAVAAVTSAARIDSLRAQQAVPNSAGTDLPKLKVPADACDCHFHVYDPMRFPIKAGVSIPNASLAEYRLLQKRIGTSRGIVVTPAPYQTDNRVTLDAVAQLGPNGRGVAVVDPTITEPELKALNDSGIRGIRFTQNPQATATNVDMIEPLSKRVSELGWNVQISMSTDQIAKLADLWQRLPSRIVFDHLGRLQSLGVEHPALGVIRGLIDKGQTWVKLSAPYIDSKVGPPTYADASAVVQALVRLAPDRMVWGSDWPHPSLDAAHKPDDATLVDLLAEWAPDEATRHRILVENPIALYGFAKSS